MAKIDSSHYLCVQDVKAHSDKPRLAILSVDSYYQLSDKAVAAVCEQGARQIGIGDAELGVSLNYEPLACDWPESFGGRSSDLEAVHAINGRPGEFLACESGYWEGKYGRLFHLRVSRDGAGWRAEVLRKYQLPDWFAGEVEGLACQLQRDGSILVVFGVRGGTPAYAPGRLHWAYISGSDPPDLSWPTDGSTGVELSWTNFSNNPGERAISDLFIDAAGGLWVAGAEDNGNAGAFRSYVWLFGMVSREPSYTISSYRNQQYYWRIDGLKIEAIAAPCTPGSPLCFATDDESYGGIWRPLPEAVTQY
ncbi:hypothetical protein IT575_08985 [bacterium]|nr:hypothetical protein [bacterium]